MRKLHWVALAGVFCMTTPAFSEKPATKAPLPQVVAKKAKLPEDDVAKMLEALGPVIRDKLANGETVELPGLGMLRVVRIPEHKDMVKGRPATIEATNNVEFVPIPEVVQAANSPKAVPAATVPVFEYDPLPNQTKSEKNPGVRLPNTRQP